MEPIFMVQLNIEASDEDRWNRWYNEVHVPEVMSLSNQIISATRYRKTFGDAEHGYLAIYRFSSQVALEAFIASPELKRMGEEYAREWGSSSVRVRGFYEPIMEVAP